MPSIELKLTEIPQEKPVRLQRHGVAIVVIRTRNGVRAFHDRCPHAQWPLSDGQVVGDILVCPGHEWQFDVTTGQCLNTPAYRLKPLPVVVSNGSVHIEWV